MHGFETLCITVGGVVNQDQALSEVVGSDATIDVSLLILNFVHSYSLACLYSTSWSAIALLILLQWDG